MKVSFYEYYMEDLSDIFEEVEEIHEENQKNNFLYDIPKKVFTRWLFDLSKRKKVEFDEYEENYDEDYYEND